MSMTTVIVDPTDMKTSEFVDFKENLEAFKGRLETALVGTRTSVRDFFEYAVMGNLREDWIVILRFNTQKMKTVSDRGGYLFNSLIGMVGGC